jgi:hypothetical protein
MVIGPDQHMNYLQFGGGGTATLTVRFNTGYQTSLRGAEGFQIYNNTMPATLLNPNVSNNTLIAKLNGGRNTMSYMVHGNCHGLGNCSTTTTQISGSAINTSNYFDASGAYGAYYPGTFIIPGASWTSSGNIDMNTGKTITPQ